MQENILKLKLWEFVPENFTGIVEYEDGTKYYVVNGEYHREDGPAIIFSNGTEEWYLNGVKHRIGGPAEYDKNNIFEIYYVNGKFHREDGPAYKYRENFKYYLNGEKINCSLDKEFKKIVKLKYFR